MNNAAGQPVAGAMVKLVNADRHLTFMVVSQEQGRFEANDLPPGQYVVQGVGAGFESSKSAPMNVEGGKNAKIDLTLANKQGTTLPPAWPHRIPEEQVKAASLDLPAGDGQSLVNERCTTCHDVRRIVVKRTPLSEWEHIIERMRGAMAIANIPDISNQEAATIANYLTANFKPEQPYDANSRLPRDLLDTCRLIDLFDDQFGLPLEVVLSHPAAGDEDVRAEVHKQGLWPHAWEAGPGPDVQAAAAKKRVAEADGHDQQRQQRGVLPQRQHDDDEGCEQDAGGGDGKWGHEGTVGQPTP